MFTFCQKAYLYNSLFKTFVAHPGANYTAAISLHDVKPTQVYVSMITIAIPHLAARVVMLMIVTTSNHNN